MDQKTLQVAIQLLAGTDPQRLNLSADQLSSATDFLSAAGLLEKTKIQLPNIPLASQAIEIVRDRPRISIEPPRPPIPIGVFLLESATIPATGIPIAKGSVWLYAQQFGAAPAGVWAGFLATAGTLTLQGTATVVDGVIHLQTADILTLTATIQPIPIPTPQTGAGADATTTVPVLPTKVKIQFAPSGATIETLDDFSLTAYGTQLALTYSGGKPTYNSSLKQLEIPATPSITTFTPTQILSTLLQLSPAPLSAGSWNLVTSTQPVAQLGTVTNSGGIAFHFDNGITAQWTNGPGPINFPSAELYVTSIELRWLFQYDDAPLNEIYQLWIESTGYRSSISLSSPGQMTITYAALAGLEAILLTVIRAVATLDRPIRADGLRQSFQWTTGNLIYTVQGANSTLGILFSVTTPPPSQLNIPIALENTMLWTAPAQSLAVIGTPAADNANNIDVGQLELQYTLNSYRPMLPDPYAAPITGQIPLVNGTLSAQINWQNPTSPVLSFSTPVLTPLPTTTGTQWSSLLDVSTAADLLGVQVSGSGGNRTVTLQVSGMSLQHPLSGLDLFAVPEISWEPMYADGSGDGVTGTIAATDEGTLPILAMPASVQLVPVAPTLMLDTFFERIAAGDEFRANFTLPFGLIANHDINGANVQRLQPQFPNGLTSGVQISIGPQPSIFGTNPGMRGSSFYTTPYGANVIGAAAAGIYNTQFQNLLPLLRYDFSGYGASTFSDWRAAKPDDTSIIQVKFQTMIGRTAHEVIEVQSFIYPWHIRVVRTITIDRLSTGDLLRHDTGWQAASDGAFDISGFQVHPGPISLIANVTRIRDQGPVIPGTPSWQPVIFDADVILTTTNDAANVNGLTVTSGTSGSDRLATQDMTGYIVESFGGPPIPPQLASLLAKYTASGPVAGIVTADKTGTSIRASMVSATCFLNGADGIVVASLNGSPGLPSDGAWSLAKRPAGGTQPPQILDPNTPVPLIRPASDPIWHLADPTDILNLTGPSNEYGFLQSTGTQKVFFSRPQMTPKTNPADPDPGFNLANTPSLADVGALFNAPGIFPNLAAALPFTLPVPNLQPSPDGLSLTATIDMSAIPPGSGNAARTIIDFGAVQILLDYHDENGVVPSPTVTISPGSWKIDLGRISFPVVTPLGAADDPMLKICGHLSAASNAAPSFSEMKIVYGSILNPIESLFSNLQFLDQFLPGGQAAQIDVSFSDGKLTIRNVFALPRLPLGVGFLENIALDIGATLQLAPQSIEFTCGIGSPDKPCQWLVSPLTGSVVVQVGVKDGDLAVLIQGGIGAALSIDVGIAEGAAAVLIQLQVSIVGTNVSLLLLLTAQASVDVLDGLASVSLSLTAGVGVTPEPFGVLPPKQIIFTAACGVGIHLTVCWLVHVDFDGYWQFSETIDVPDITSVLPI
jgi:hypothetical protein